MDVNTQFLKIRRKFFFFFCNSLLQTFLHIFAISLIFAINLEKWQKLGKKNFVLFLTIYYENMVYFGV